MHISQVVTETELVNRSNALEEALANGNFVEFCNGKIAKAQDDTEKEIWNFLKVGLELFMNFKWFFVGPLKRYCTPKQKLAFFVLYLKIFNTFWKMIYANCPRELKNSIKI